MNWHKTWRKTESRLLRVSSVQIEYSHLTQVSFGSLFLFARATRFLCSYSNNEGERRGAAWRIERARIQGLIFAEWLQQTRTVVTTRSVPCCSSVCNQNCTLRLSCFVIFASVCVSVSGWDVSVWLFARYLSLFRACPPREDWETVTRCEAERESAMSPFVTVIQPE